MEIVLAQPRGFCAGVTRAIEIVKGALAVYGAPVYVRHEIVHNRTVVGDLKKMGAVFIENLDEVPEGAVLIFSAHGVPAVVQSEAERRNFRLFDATCPLVKKVHREVIRMHSEGRHILMIGHAKHPEVEATMGQIDGGITLVETADDVAQLPTDLADKPLAFVTQTTISVDDAREVIDALKTRFPAITEPKKADVCYATQNRQDAVKKLAELVDLILVIGSVTSSNSNRLREVSERCGVKAYLIDSARHLEPQWFDGVTKVGITAGASAPEALVQGVVSYIKDTYGVTSVSVPENSVEENVVFPMPKGLWKKDIEGSAS